MPLNLNRIDLNLLIVLDAVFQERSVSRAAIRVGRSQPAISNALQRLRALFKDELLMRVGQRYELSARAQAIADPLHIMLQQLDEVLVARPTFDPQKAEREFKIGASDYAATVILRPVIQRIAAIAPRISITIEAPGQDPGTLLRRGQQDLAFYPVEHQPKAADLRFETITRDTWCCVTWAGNPMLGKQLTRETFESLPHIIDLFTGLPEKGTVGSLLAGMGMHRKHNVRTNYILLIPFLLEGTSTLAVVPRRLADWLCQAAALRALPLPFEFPNHVIGMCWSSRHTADPAHLWLRTLLKETSGNLPQIRRAPAIRRAPKASRKRA